MNKEYIIRKNEEIEKIIKRAKKIYFNDIYIYKDKNDYKYNRYCISVSKKIGHAVIRNKLRRQIKDILMKYGINLGYDYIIVLKQSFKDLSYEAKKDEILKIFKGETI